MGSRTETGATLLATPARATADQPVRITLTGLSPGAQATLRASLCDDFGRTWEAHAIFVADAMGEVDVARQAPHAGTYEGVEPMGLFWSMLPADGKMVNARVKQDLAPTAVTLRAEIDGTPVATVNLERLSLPDGVERIPVREHGLVGTLFLPSGHGPFPGMLVFSGSGGGIEEGRAALLAAHGYAAFALAYFFAEGLPDSLVDIPLEYFERGLRWLAERPEIQADRIGVTGASRGGELVLLLGATFPSIKAVVAYVPSHVIWSGFGKDWDEQSAAWTYRGEAITPMPPAASAAPPPDIAPGDPIPLTPYFLHALENRAGAERAAIPVERIAGPVMLIAGEADAMWPSARMAAQAAERLERHGHLYPVVHLAYPDAGHAIRPPYVPTTVAASEHPVDGGLYAYGGTAPGNARANEDSWQRLLAFLDEHLRGSGSA